MVDAPGNNHRRSSSSSSSEVSVDYELQVAGEDDASRSNGNGNGNGDVTEPSPITEAVEADTGRNSCSVSVSSGPVGQSLPEDEVSHNENDVRESSAIGEEVEASQTDTDHNSSYVSISSGSVGQSLPEDDFSHNGNGEVREPSSIREAVEASQTDADHNLCSVSIASGSLGELLAQDDVSHDGNGHGNVRESSANREAAKASQMNTGHNAVSISPGPLGQSLTEQNISSVDRPTADTSVPTADHLVKHRGHRRKNSFSLLAAKVFDDKFPLKKKIKLLRKLASVKNDGTVQFEVPGDIKPQALDFGTGHIYNGATGEEAVDATDIQDIPPLQIVMLIVGTRGDVQPFVAIGKKLQGYGHRVRLATHSNFKEFVLAAGLEFFPLGGDPKVLAEYMVKNKGFLPSGPSEIPIQRNQMKEIIFSLLPACTLPDPDTKVPFQVDAIIANPPAYGHVHVAEALKVPIHIYFTMPWTPTSEFPHPLSRVRQPVGYRLSYQIVDTLIWLGIRDMINDFRKKRLKLRPVTYLSGSYYSPMEIPYGYIWSPHLVPKPKDWGPKIDVVGFCFLDLASSYVPPESLVKWLEAGTKPLYIGFGSLPVQEPEKMTQIIVEALEITGQRGIINKGWGGLGNLAEPKDFVYSLDNCPHDWLFLRCAAVVHHGGAGTTAAGLKAACPTTVVPFFGDQPFWGERVHARGVGPLPIPVEEFSLDKLVAAIRFMLEPEVKQRAVELAKAMENEDGVTGAVNAFYRHFPRKKVEPDHDPDEVPRRRRSRLSISRCFSCTS